jgi:dihydropteroate synthase
LVDRARQATTAGVVEVWIDPGIGFGKTLDHNLRLLGAVGDLVATGYPVMVGTSRKSFLGALATLADGSPAPVGQRLAASLATATWAMEQGAQMVRVHDVAATVEAAVLVGPIGAEGSAGSHRPGSGRSEKSSSGSEVGA